MSRRKKHHLDDEAEESGELNLTPYLDIITTLVIFLIFTFQVVIEFRLIELLPPAYTGQTAGSASEENPTVTLTMFIHDKGYKLVTNQPELGAVDIPLKGGEYDNERLTQELDRVKRALGIGDSLIITAADDIAYSVVVAAMDASREFESRRLFPDVLLARASAGGG
jgi:biopolymer transport protein TolR